MSGNQVWPKDKINNEIREGDLIQLKTDDTSPLFYVASVKPARVITSPEGNMPVNGEIELVLKFNLPFAPDINQLSRAIVVKQPKVEEEDKRMIV